MASKEAKGADEVASEGSESGTAGVTPDMLSLLHKQCLQMGLVLLTSKITGLFLIRHLGSSSNPGLLKAHHRVNS